MKRSIIICIFVVLTASAAWSQGAGMRTVKFLVEDMSCQNCVNTIEKNIALEAGVTDVKCDLETHTAVVTFSADKTSEEKLVKAFDRINYSAKAPDGKAKMPDGKAKKPDERTEALNGMVEALDAKAKLLDEKLKLLDEKYKLLDERDRSLDGKTYEYAKDQRKVNVLNQKFHVFEEKARVIDEKIRAFDEKARAFERRAKELDEIEYSKVKESNKALSAKTD